MNQKKLRSLSADKIENWRVDFIKRKGINPLKERSARVSANSFIRCARSLFGRDVLAQIRDIVEIPEPVPFSGVKIEKVRVPRYRSTFDMVVLLESAREEPGPVQARTVQNLSPGRDGGPAP